MTTTPGSPGHGNFRTDYPIVYGRPVLQGHADACKEFGHATWTQDGNDKGICPRCGDVTPVKDTSPVATIHVAHTNLPKAFAVCAYHAGTALAVMTGMNVSVRNVRGHREPTSGKTSYSCFCNAPADFYLREVRD